MPSGRNIQVICAILAGFALLLWKSEVWASDDLEKPISVEFRLLDGVRIRGSLSSWDRDGFDGSFGRRYWHEIHLDDARSLFFRVMDRSSGIQWLDFGRMLLQHEDGDRLADLAFKRAVELDESLQERVEGVRKEVAQILLARDETSTERQAAKLRTQSPEANDWPADPWPELSPQEQQAARLTMIADAEQLMKNAGLEWQLINSAFFHVYTDMDRVEAATLAVEGLDATYRAIARTFGVSVDKSVFWGKPVVFIFQSDDAFRVFEASMFNQYVRSEQMAITHYEGPKVFILAVNQQDKILTRSVLAREVTHAFLHRYISPHRLPPWANEGLAEFFAQQPIEESLLHEGQRATALQLIRGGYPFGQLLLKTWDEDSWQGAREQGYAIVHLFIDFLIDRYRNAFINWVNACKRGDDWKEAMQDKFGGNVSNFAQAFYRFYRVND